MFDSLYSDILPVITVFSLGVLLMFGFSFWMDLVRFAPESEKAKTFWQRFKAYVSTDETKLSISYYGVFTVLYFLLYPLQMAYLSFAESISIPELQILAKPDWAQGFSAGAVVYYFGVYILSDFLYYWAHRIDHEVRFFWSGHMVHHSPNSLDSCFHASRLNMPDLGVIFSYGIVIVLTGLPIQEVMTVVAFLLIGQVWVHSERVPRLAPWVEFIFNTPSSHRVHHSKDMDCLDKNYGAVFIIWDRIFGTYKAEPDRKISIGLIKEFNDRNAFIRNQAEGYVECFKYAFSLLSRGRPVAAFLSVIMPPGWAPDGKGETTRDLLRKAAKSGVSEKP